MKTIDEIMEKTHKLLGTRIELDDLRVYFEMIRGEPPYETWPTFITEYLSADLAKQWCSDPEKVGFLECIPRDLVARISKQHSDAFAFFSLLGNTLRKKSFESFRGEVPRQIAWNRHRDEEFSARVKKDAEEGTIRSTAIRYRIDTKTVQKAKRGEIISHPSWKDENYEDPSPPLPAEKRTRSEPDS